MSMKIKTALDMQGNGIENFLIQGVSAIEGLSDKSLGRKILYTGTNTDRNYREMIYIGNSIGGDGWRTTAYTSDVDELRGLITALESATDEEIEALKGRTTTLEGRVDTIDNMLNVENSQTVVDTWEEVKKFLASVSEETDLITLLNGKANWSGDIAIDDIKSLGYGKNSGTTGWVYNGPAISFGANTTYFAQLQVNFQKDNLVFRRHTNEGFSDWREVLHQGNFASLIGDTYLKTTGGTINGTLTVASHFSVGENASIGGRLTMKGLIAFDQYNETGKTYLLGMTNAGSPLKWYDNTQWNTILHSGNYSDLITTLNGSLSVGGNMTLAQDKYYRMTNATKDIVDILRIHTNNVLYIAYGTYEKGQDTYLWGKNIKFIYGGKGQTAIAITEAGNVGIGVDNPQNALDVNGNVDIKYMLSVGTHVLTPKIKSNAGIDITAYDGDASSSIFLDKGVLRPYSSGKNLIDLGSSTIRWKGVYSGTGDFSGNVTFNAELIGKTETGGSFARWRIATSENGTFFQAGSVDSTKAQGVLYLSGINGTYLEKLNILSDLAVVSNKLHIGHIANDDGSALQINGDIHVTGNIIADGEVSAGGAGTEGNGGAGGFSLYESWGTSAPTEPLALGANLGYELKTRVEDLELAKTKVTFEPELVSGKPIGAITIDGNKTNLFAPATYAWSEITGTENVLTTAGGVISGGTGAFTIKRDSDTGAVIRFDNTKGLLGYLGVAADGKPIFLNKDGSDRILLHSGNYSDYALPKTGGELKGLNPYHQYILTLDTDNVYYTILSLKSQGVRKGDFRWTSDDTTIVGVSIYNATTKDALGLSDDGLPMYNKYTLLHTGNVGEYALKNYANQGKIDFNDVLYNGVQYVSSSSSNAPITRVLVSFKHGDSAWQIAGGRTDSQLRYRGSNGTSDSWSDWKTIAFTDSDITGYSAGLRHSNGTVGATVDDKGRILTSGYGVCEKNENWQLSTAGYIGNVQGTISDGVELRSPKGIVLATNKIGLLINTSGNVTIGSQDLAGSDYKLWVNGSTVLNIGYHLLSGTSNPVMPTKPSEINPQTTFSIIRGHDNKYGLHTWIQSNGDVYMQSSYADQDRDGCYALNLNPLGGAVNIASANAHTNVLGELKVGSGAMGYINMVGTSVNYLWAANTIHIGLSTVGGGSGDNATLTIKNDSIHSGFRNNAVSLGTSSYRWSNVYSTLGNFSSRVLIGAVTDDTESALQVKGKITVGHTAHDRLILTTQDVTAVFDGHDELDGWMDYVFKSDGTELFYIGAKESQTSRFRRAIRFYGTTTIGGSLIAEGSSAFYGSTTFGKEGVSMQVNFKCPVVAEDRVTIGGATLRWDDEIKALRLNTSLAATGELSAGGAGTEGGNTGGGTGTIASPFSRTFTPNEKTSFTFSHDLPYYDVVVQVYEWDSSGMCWNMVLADIEIQNNDVTVTLGRKENVEHKIVVR